MSDWQRIIDSCELISDETPEDIFDVSEMIDEFHTKHTNLETEHNRLLKDKFRLGNENDKLYTENAELKLQLSKFTKLVNELRKEINSGEFDQYEHEGISVTYHCMKIDGICDEIEKITNKGERS